jgi:hypothetical protein
MKKIINKYNDEPVYNTLGNIIVIAIVIVILIGLWKIIYNVISWIL